MKQSCHWNMRDEERAGAEVRLAADLGVTPLLARILVNRGIHSFDEAQRFLFPSLKHLHDPFLLKDMDRAVDRVAEAVLGNELIGIFGDYDVDGVTSSAILFTFLRELTERVSWYIPDRISEGYGLRRDAVETLHHKGVSLIVTVDCGISNHDEIAHAATLGMDTIVLDHHEVPERLPPARAVVNQNRPDNEFPFRHLAGVGVVFNFLMALRNVMRRRGLWKNRAYPNLKDYLDLVALGTIADSAPLIDENRIFAKTGLSLMEKGGRPGVRALKTVSSLASEDMDAAAAAFRLIPRLNAAGRVGRADEALHLLLADDYDQALPRAQRLDLLNRERQELERTIVTDLVRDIESDPSLSGRSCFVFASPEWHPGVIGIVASRLVERYYRPALLISLNNGIGRGSGRSIAEFNLYDGIASRCIPLLRAFGGHRQAVGLSIDEENIEEFSRRLNDAAARTLGDTVLVPSLSIDGECRLHEIDYELLSHLELVAPHGVGNPEPLLRANNVLVTSHTVVGDGHLRITVADGETQRDGIWFHAANRYGSLDGMRLDIVFSPQLNRWRGSRSIQLKIRDALPAANS